MNRNWLSTLKSRFGTKPTRRREIARYVCDGAERLEDRRLLSASPVPGEVQDAGEVEPLPAPRITSPHTDTTGTRPEVTWEAVAGAKSYDIHIYHIETGKLVDHDSGIDGTAYQVSEAFGDSGRYSVHVRAVDEAGAAGQWCEAVSFAVAEGVPNAPELADVESAEAGNPPQLKWQEVDGAAGYEVAVYNNETGQEVSRKTLEAETSYQPDWWWSHRGNYQAFVRAAGEDGQLGGWSTVGFTVEGDPAAEPTRQDTTTSSSRTRTLNWEAIEGAQQYEVVVYDVTTGQQVFRKDDATDTQLDIDADMKLNEGRYQVFIRGLGEDGSPGIWSKPFEFDLAALPPARDAA